MTANELRDQFETVTSRMERGHLTEEDRIILRKGWENTLALAERLKAENAWLRKLLTRTHAAWMLEASQGDGIMEEHRQVDLDCRAVLEGGNDDST